MLNTAPLYHQLADQIHAMIRSGTLRAGEKVPSALAVRALKNSWSRAAWSIFMVRCRMLKTGRDSKGLAGITPA